MFHQLKLRVPAMVPIPTGSFLMGSTQTQIETAATQFGLDVTMLLDELPQHQIELAAFEISRGPITCAEYRAFLIATDHPPPAYWNSDDPPVALLDHPVVGVSLDDARHYCRWLSTATQRDFRLPGEAQWEKAARGNDARSFPWGEGWNPGFCNIIAGGPGATSPVGSFAQDLSPYGCVDMAGNVAEWILARYRPYPGSNLAAPAQASVVVRGGRWNGSADLSRCARRQSADGAASLSIGFRVVCVAE